MAASPTVSNNCAIGACDFVVDALDGGSGAGTFKIYSGTRPARTDVAISDQTELVSITLNDPAFGAAADDSTNSKATATCNCTGTNGVASNTNTASWFRAYDSDDVAVVDGSVGTASADAIIDSTAISSGATVVLVSWTFSVGEGTAS